MDEGNRTGARRRKGLGWKPHWVWSGSADEILAWVRAKGPLVFSTQWFDSKFGPDEIGYVYARAP